MNEQDHTLDIGLLVLGYCRADMFERAARSLERLGLPKTTPCYGVIDGARVTSGPSFVANRTTQERAQALLREGVLTDLTIRSTNLGTMRNVFQSVTEVLARHKFVFVLEDDLEILPIARDAIQPLIAHMGGSVTAFGIYCHRSWSKSVFLSRRFSSQAWGTSRESWCQFDVDEIKNLTLTPTQVTCLATQVGTDIMPNLKSFQAGTLDSWALPWNIFNFLRGGTMVYAPNSYVVNNSHLAGAQRTHGIKFTYETSILPVVDFDTEFPALNAKYLQHFTTWARIRRRFWAEVAKIFAM